MTPQTPRRARRLALVLAAALAIAGCATRAEEPPPAAPADAFPVTVTAPNGKPLTLDRKPERIVSLSASATETLFAIGAGKQVVAVDEQSTFPAEAPKTTLSGLTPNVEAIAGHTPNLVIASGDAGDMVAGLGKLGIPVLILPAAKSLDDVYAQFDLVGKATGNAAQGADLARRTKEDIEKIVRDTPKSETPLSYYHELDTDLYSVTSKTFIGKVYGLFGMTNIADAADTDASGYPKLSAEYVIKANPTLIFLGDTKCCGQTAETVALRPGWNTIDAVTKNRVVALDDDLASRWGPRIVDLVRAVADALK
ncbi:ABC transporter substrate-binding protein [Actinokineospora sp.]|uniref:ABC transporter substrate-binding protein n=1 Tax=Actinokineospora sp. TaxID=1872133 RepID=UPI003D6B738B